MINSNSTGVNRPRDRPVVAVGGRSSRSRLRMVTRSVPVTDPQDVTLVVLKQYV